MVISLRVFVLGATGESGRETVRALATSDKVGRIVLLNRRNIPMESSWGNNPEEKIEQKIIDFENLSQSDFSGFDAGFCCLGTTRAKAGSAAAFRKVDHDYVVSCAEKARAENCHHFTLVTSGGANPRSWFLYPKTKGEVEEEVKKLGFSRLSIFRPALLLCDRREKRSGEAIFQAVARGVDRWHWGSVKTSDLADVMVANALSLNNVEKPVEIFQNSDIIKMAEKLKAAGEL